MPDLTDVIREWLKPVPAVDQWGPWSRHTYNALTAVIGRHRSERYDDETPPYCSECSGLAGYRVPAPCRTVRDVARELGIVVGAVLSADEFERAMNRLVHHPGTNSAELEGVKAGLPAIEDGGQVRMPESCSTLVSSVLPGDGVFDPPEVHRRFDEILGRDGEMHPVPKGRPLSVAAPVPAGSRVSLDAGAPWGESHRVTRCTGRGPFLVELEAPLHFAHAAGTALKVVDHE